MTQSPAIYGLVLAGGRSRRFGRDKAAVQIEGQALLERTVKLLRALIDEVFVSVRSDQQDEPLRRQFRLIVDQLDGLGPAAGILAAHGEWPEAAWLVLACDMPLVDESAVGGLLEARNSRRAATAYRSAGDGLPEPLCAIYEPDTLARFRHQTESGDDPSPRNFLVHADVELIEPPGKRVLSNVNTRDELSRLGTNGDAE